MVDGGQRKAKAREAMIWNWIRLGFPRTEHATLSVAIDERFPPPEMTMVRTILALGLLAMSLAALNAHAQTAPGAVAQPATSAVDPASIQALKDMGAFLHTLKRFRVMTELTGERVLADGQKLQHTASASLDVERPNKLRVRMHSARSERELFFDGKAVTLYTPAQKYYSTVELSDTIGGLIDRLEAKYGVQLPMQDLFRWGTPAAPFDKIESAMNGGQDFIDDELCDHYAFRQGKNDWQIWIATGNKPLPRKLVITNRSDEARPQSVQVFEWNLKPTFKDAVFKFTPPKGATRIEIVPVKSN
jgi:hypothetical protein